MPPSPVRRVLRGFGAALLVLAVAIGQSLANDLSLLEKAYALDSASAARDATGAAQLYQTAANGGDPFAHLRLGQLYEVGDGVPQDYATARAHYQTAADLGLAAARVPLAICHLEGWGGPVDREAFVREIRQAAEAGETAAQHILGLLHGIGLYVAKDLAASVAWLEKAGKSDAGAQHNLGQVVDQAQRFVTARNLEIARHWYQLSAEREYLTGMRAMARTFIEGAPEARDWAMFRQWLELADEAGDAEAPFILAMAEMLRPDLKRRDEARATEWIITAAQRGNSRALEVLDGRGAGQSLRDAITYVLVEAWEDRYVRRVQQRFGDGPTRGPVPYKTVMPVYPMGFRLAGITGNVKLQFTVDTTGRPRDITAVSATHPLFGERARAAVEQWRFHPARKDGRLVNSRAQVDIPFTLADETADGTDGLLAMARDKAEMLGPEFVAYLPDLRIARPVTALPVPKRGVGPANERRMALVLLALDATGKPQHGRVLHAEPADLGDEVLTIVLQARFKPREVNGEAVPSNVLVPFFSEAMGEPVTPATP